MSLFVEGGFDRIMLRNLFSGRSVKRRIGPLPQKHRFLFIGGA
ncbi:hypothetical protein B4135_0216 [Caldibacillus debilis]|uniref:Uncharacterized protein n=1 Tax=Caldibacillus debilis TaxID=301148 RepID=A0A150M9U5_9BACI|nr:hypothetical protein B4135_0216 [Caldibacillus debilis]